MRVELSCFSYKDASCGAEWIFQCGMLQGVSLLDNLQPGMQDLTYKCNGKVKVGRKKQIINGIKSQEKCHSWKQTQVNYVSSSNWELRIDYSVVSLNGSVQKTFWKHFGKVPLKVEHVGRKLMGRTEIRIKLGELSTFWQKQKPGKVWKLLGRTRIKIKQKCRWAVKTFEAKWGAE